MPLDQARIRVDAELRSLTDSLRRSEFADRFVWETLLAVRRGDLVAALRDVRPHIVHFGGHGVAAEGLLLENEQGDSEALSPDDLAGILRSAGGVVLAVFNACESGTFLDVVTRGAQCAIGPREPLEDDVALVLTSALYASIGAGKSVGAAFDDALRAIHAVGMDDSGLRLAAAPGVDPREVIVAGEGSPLAPLDLSLAFSVDRFYKP